MSIEGMPGRDYYVLVYGWSMTELVREVNALQIKCQYQCIGSMGQQTGGVYVQPMVNHALLETTAGTSKAST
jgi:hypothetical protein